AGYGSIGAVFNGVPAFCQLNDDFGFYQCDELGNRYMRDALAHPDIDNAAVDYAATMCTKASALSAYSVWGPMFRPQAGQALVPGDLVVRNAVPGHVAVVTSVATDHIEVMQQNEPTLTAELGWDAGTNFFTDPSIICWIHAEPSPPAP